MQEERNNTTRIYEFDPVIYPFRLWVAINPPLDEIKEKFYGLTTDNERVEIQDDLNDCFKIATTSIKQITAYFFTVHSDISSFFLFPSEFLLK